MPKAKRKTESAVDVSSTRLLGLLADIRAAVGDPTGKLMQDELVEHCRELKRSADWNIRRVEMLSRMQKHMRDPERTLVRDIIENCQLLPDPDGKRYGFAATGAYYSPLQAEILAKMHKIKIGRTAAGIANSIGKPTLSVAGALRGLQSRKMVTSYLHGDPKWPTRYWCLANAPAHRPAREQE